LSGLHGQDVATFDANLDVSTGGKEVDDDVDDTSLEGLR
jgi:hypothetical protein